MLLKSPGIQSFNKCSGVIGKTIRQTAVLKLTHTREQNKTKYRTQKSWSSISEDVDIEKFYKQYYRIKYKASAWYKEGSNSMQQTLKCYASGFIHEDYSLGTQE